MSSAFYALVLLKEAISMSTNSSVKSWEIALAFQEEPNPGALDASLRMVETL